MSSTRYIKQRPEAPAGFFAAEAAGLAWLAEPAALPVVRVLGHSQTTLELERLTERAPSADDARAFGAGLARLHDAGAPAFGWTPAPTAWFGPLDAPLPVINKPRASFSQMWAGDRLAPLAECAAPTLGDAGAREVEAAIAAIRDGAFDGIAGSEPEAPARCHGDLWSGNVLWTADGGTLIDPAAHGGHRLEDLAMLHLFGAPHLEEILVGYQLEHPLPDSWREDIPAHQLYGLLAHVVLFGRAYVGATVTAARRVVDRARALGVPLVS